MIITIKTLFAEHHQKIRNRNFLEATMAAIALVALADGKVNLAEIMARDFVLHHVPELQAFEPEEAIEIYSETIEALETSLEVAKRRVFKAVAKLSIEKDLGILLIRICTIVARWDESFDERERKVVMELCDLLKLEDIPVYDLLQPEPLAA